MKFREYNKSCFHGGLFSIQRRIIPLLDENIPVEDTCTYWRYHHQVCLGWGGVDPKIESACPDMDRRLASPEISHVQIYSLLHSAQCFTVIIYELQYDLSNNLLAFVTQKIHSIVTIVLGGSRQSRMARLEVRMPDDADREGHVRRTRRIQHNSGMQSYFVMQRSRAIL